jgi:carbon storage regulator
VPVLVLTRKAKESITIGSNVQVIVLEVRGSQVRLGVRAPKEMPVNRTEIYDLILEENIKASNAPPDLGHLPTFEKSVK